MKNLEVIKQVLLSIIDRIDSGNINLDENQYQEALDLINKMVVPETKYSKDQACSYLGLSRATFDRYVRDGLIPRGRKQKGFKELFYIKQDLDDAKIRMNHR